VSVDVVADADEVERALEHPRFGGSEVLDRTHP